MDLLLEFENTGILEHSATRAGPWLYLIWYNFLMKYNDEGKLLLGNFHSAIEVFAGWEYSRIFILSILHNVAAAVNLEIKYYFSETFVKKPYKNVVCITWNMFNFLCIKKKYMNRDSMLIFV